MQNGIRRDLMKRKIQRIHFVGIGGTGMSGLAEVLLRMDYKISGSDLVARVPITRSTYGARVKISSPSCCATHPPTPMTIPATSTPAAAPDPATKWKYGNCNLATHIKNDKKETAQKVNPLKASKRANKK